MSLLFLDENPNLESNETEVKAVLKSVSNLVTKALKQQDKSIQKTLSVSLDRQKFGLKIGYDLNNEGEDRWISKPLDRFLMLIDDDEEFSECTLDDLKLTKRYAVYFRKLASHFEKHQQVLEKELAEERKER